MIQVAVASKALSVPCPASNKTKPKAAAPTLVASSPAVPACPEQAHRSSFSTSVTCSPYFAKMVACKREGCGGWHALVSRHAGRHGRQILRHCSSNSMAAPSICGPAVMQSSLQLNPRGSNSTRLRAGAALPCEASSCE